MYQSSCWRSVYCNQKNILGMYGLPAVAGNWSVHFMFCPDKGSSVTLRRSRQGFILLSLCVGPDKVSEG